jgi:alpha-1,2-mannosyltransferase
LGGLWLLYFRFLKDRPVAAGIVASAMTFKPHMGLFVGLSALTNWRTALFALVGIAALIALSAWAFDPASLYGFIGQTLSAQTEILTRAKHEFYFRMMPSAFTAYGRGQFALMLQLTIAVGALTMLYLYNRIYTFVIENSTFLVVPYVFVYDMTVACLGFAIILWRDWSVLRKWEKTVLTIAFLIPVIALGINRLGAMIAPPVLLAALYIQTKSSRDPVAIPDQPHPRTAVIG